MTIVLHEENFVNDKLQITYGGKYVAEFTIVNTEFQGNNGIGNVNKINIWVREIYPDGSKGPGSKRSPVIGLGDDIVGVTTSIPELRGKVLSKDNMSQCTIELYEGK